MGTILGWMGIAGLLLAVSPVLAQEKQDQPAPKSGEFKTIKEKVSYGFGMDIGRNIARNMSAQELDVDHAALIKGIQDSLAGAESRVAEEDMQAALKVFQKELIAKAKKRREDEALARLETDEEFKAQAVKNAKEGEEFLKQNKAKEGVKITESGLHYQVIKEGTGKKPMESDIVKTHYHGTFPDGKVFDSSVERKQPATFTVDGVIDGWTEALQMMPVGSKWRLVVPSKLAYGLSGSGRAIGPNQVLVFEVELLSIESPDEEGNPPAEAPQKQPAPEKK